MFNEQNKNTREKHKNPQELASEASISDLFMSAYGLVVESAEPKQNSYFFKGRQGQDIAVGIADDTEGEEMAKITISTDSPIDPNTGIVQAYDIKDDGNHLRISKSTSTTYEITPDELRQPDEDDEKIEPVKDFVNEKEIQELKELIESRRKRHV